MYNYHRPLRWRLSCRLTMSKPDIKLEQNRKQSHKTRTDSLLILDQAFHDQAEYIQQRKRV